MRNQCYIEFWGISTDFESTALPIYRNLWTLVVHAKFPVHIWNREIPLKHHECFVKMYEWHVLWCLQIQGASFCVWIWWRPTCYYVSSSFQVSCFHHLQSWKWNEFNSNIVTVTYCCFLYHDSLRIFSLHILECHLQFDLHFCYFSEIHVNIINCAFCQSSCVAVTVLT